MQVELRARDGGGAEASAHEWSFTVQERPQFHVLEYTRGNGQNLSSADIVWNVTQRANSPFAAGEAFRIAAANLTKVENADASRCTFTLKGNATAAGLFINPATGAVQGFIDIEGFYGMALVARAEHGAEHVLEDVVLDVRKEDLLSLKNGPGGTGCGKHGRAVDSGSRFDGQFVCECDSRFQGANCEVEASSTDSGAVVAGVLVPIILLLCLSYAHKKYQEYAVKMAPVDFKQEFQSLVDAGDLPDAISDQIGGAKIPRELPRHWLTLIDRLGSGNFGEVRCLTGLQGGVCC